MVDFSNKIPRSMSSFLNSSGDTGGVGLGGGCADRWSNLFLSSKSDWIFKSDKKVKVR